MDAWLLFGLVLPFVGFILSILEELVHEDEDQTKVEQIKILEVSLHIIYSVIIPILSEHSPTMING